VKKPKPVETEPVGIIEHDFTGTQEDWEDRVFIAATRAGHFNVVAARDKTTQTYPCFSDAALAAWNNLNLLVYAVAPSGRFVCCIRKRWKHYLDLQKATEKAING
jgi:hypothetical protein